MTECVIFGGAPSVDTEHLQSFDFTNKCIIAADSGYCYAKRLGLNVNFLVGDFDSLEEDEVIAENIYRHPSKKDDTDMMLCARLCIKKGFKKVYILCSLGGRLDHAFANIQVLNYFIENGVEPIMISENERICIVKNGEISVENLDGWSLSVFSVTDNSSGVYISGTKYLLENSELTSSFPVGVCNQIEDKNAVISVKKGTLLIIQSKICNQNPRIE